VSRNSSKRSRRRTRVGTVFANGLRCCAIVSIWRMGIPNQFPSAPMALKTNESRIKCESTISTGVEAPQIREKVIMIDGLPNELSAATSNAGKRLITTDNGTRDQTEVPRFSIPPGALETPLTTPTTARAGRTQNRTKGFRRALEIRGALQAMWRLLNRAGSAIRAIAEQFTNCLQSRTHRKYLQLAGCPSSGSSFLTLTCALTVDARVWMT